MTSIEARERRTALLIGSSVRGLQGVRADVNSMRETLHAWNFQCIELVDADATRKEILSALRDLVERATAGDVVVIYYSGHGGRCRLVEREGEPPGPSWRFLVPWDVDSEGEFRPIAEFELAGILDDLSRRTANVTVILDCCHSATLARGPGEMSRALPERTVMPGELQQSLAELAKRPRSLEPEGHQDVVRIVAAAADSEAFELCEPDRIGGHLTNELCAALAESLVVPLPWDTILGQVRERIFERREDTAQRPHVEGPSWRLPFSTHEPAHDGERNTFVLGSNGTPWLRAGRLHGLSMGEPVHVEIAATIAASGKIVELFDDAARLELEPVAGAPMLRSGSAAVVRSPVLRRKVWVDTQGRSVPTLLSALGRSLRVSLVDEEQDADYVVTAGSGGLEVSGPRGLTRVARPETDAGVAALVADLDRLARADVLDCVLALPPGLGAGPDPIHWEAEVFVTDPGGESPRPVVPGETLSGGSRIYVELRHRSRGMPTLYVNVLNRCVGGRVRLVNRSEPAGVQLKALETRWVGRRRYGGPPGMRLEWPADVPRRAGAEELLVFVVSQRPVDLRSLVESPDRAFRGAHGRGTTAQELETPLPWTVSRVGFGIA